MKRYLLSALCLLSLASGPAFAETMDEALLSGLVKSDNLNAARQNYIAIRETLTIANASNDLTGTVTITGAQTETDRKNSSGGFQSSQSLSSRIAISKQLFDSGEGNARIEAANYNLMSAEASYRATEQREILSIIDAYLSLITSRQARALQEENVARLEAQTSATKIRLEAGTTTATRLAEAKARLARAQSSLISANATEENALEKYQSLTGLSGEGLSVPSLSDAMPTSLVEAEELALKNHPDIIVASANERASRMQFDVVARQVLPKVNFSLSATDSQAKGTMQDKLDIKGEVKLTSPFLVTPSSRAKGKEISAKLERAKFQLSEARRTVSLNARSALRSTMSAAAQKRAVDAELAAAELVAEGITAEVEFGQKIFLDQLDAEQSVSDAKVRQLQAQQAVMINHFRLLAAIGQLDASAIGLAEDLPSIQDAIAPRDVFTGFLPLADLPE